MLQVLRHDHKLGQCQVPVPVPETVPETVPKVTLLMSFPNSGTSYTIREVWRLAQTNTGTNYEAESETKNLET